MKVYVNERTYNGFIARKSFGDVADLEIDSKRLTAPQDDEVVETVIEVLKANNSVVETIAFSCTGISDEYVEALIDGLTNNKTIKELSLNICYISDYVENSLRDALRDQIFNIKLSTERRDPLEGAPLSVVVGFDEEDLMLLYSSSSGFQGQGPS